VKNHDRLFYLNINQIQGSQLTARPRQKSTLQPWQPRRGWLNLPPGRV